VAGKGPRNKYDADGRNTLGMRRKSPKTGKPFTAWGSKPRKPGTTRPGPSCRRDKFREAIEATINSPLLDNWATGEQIAWEANKSIPVRWSQITPFVVGQIMRKYIASEHIERDRFKTLDPFSYKRLKYI